MVVSAALASNEANPSSISVKNFSLSKQEDCGVENLTLVSKKDGNFVVAVSKSQKIHAHGIHFCSGFCSCFHETKDFHWPLLSGGSWCTH